jgi:hypothetical protein
MVTEMGTQMAIVSTTVTVNMLTYGMKGRCCKEKGIMWL